MARTVKHFSLHRIAGTELRVVADVEAGVLSVVQVEEAVIRRYAGADIRISRWPHRWVTLFILRDLQPLARQLRPASSPQDLAQRGADLPPGGAVALDYRPVVNVYDLADLDGCHVFVNQQAMAKEGYWDDPLSIQALLAHEHAHPLAENETTSASRRLRLELSLADSRWQIADSGQEPSATSHPAIRPSSHQLSAISYQLSAISYQQRAHRLLTLLAEKLCVYAPREIFANQMTITSGFGEALLHLDRLNVANAASGVAGRDELRRQLQQEITRGTLTPAGAGALLLIGDLRGYLDLALETAPFYRTGREREARELEAVLVTDVFPHLEPPVARAYAALREHYVALGDDLPPSEMVAWGDKVLNILADALAEKGLTLQYHLRIDKRDG